MVFSSLTFLYAFLPAALLVYFVCPARLRNGALLLVSLVFYGWGEPVYILIMLLTIAVNYVAGRLIGRFGARTGRSRAVMAVAVALSLLTLGFFKYTDFIIGSVGGLFGSDLGALGIALPIGISFYTFQTLSYTIDVWRGDVKAQSNVVAFAAYVVMFPQLIAGPIVRYREVERQLAKRTVGVSGFACGVRRFVVGLSKKVLLANRAGELWSTVSAIDVGELPAATAWLGAVAFAFQIYFDFSAYSDMAIGLGRMLGFSFAENFDYPYISSSVTEFWRRWHISLGTWFREYLYIPLGGNRNGTARTALNLLLVWTVTGLWHGASWNFVIWGFYFGVLIAAEKLFLSRLLDRLPKVVSTAAAMLAVLLGWVLFASENLPAALAYLGAMLGASGSAGNSETVYLLYTNAVLLALCALGSTALPKRLWRSVTARLENAGTIGAAAGTVIGNAAVLLAMALSTACLVSDTYNPFLYFRF